MSAAASENLMTLLSQLQLMESSISSIIMESTMKLCAMTSASIFLLIETTDGRKFTGSQHLTDAYISRVLGPNESDVHVNVDLNTKATHEFPLQNGVSTFNAHLPNNHFQNETVNHSLKTNHLKRPAYKNRHLSSPKRTKLNQVEIKRETNQDLKQDHTVGQVDPNQDAHQELSTRQSNVIFNDSNQPFSTSSLEGEFTLSDSESDIEILGSDALPTETSVAAAFNGGVGAADGAADGAAAYPCDESLTFRSDLSFAAELPLNDAKMNALKSIADPMLAFQRGTVECRLLTSVFYDYGKDLAKRCPFPLDLKDPETNRFYRSHVERFMEEFPNLGLNPNDGRRNQHRLHIEIGSTKVSPEAFVKQNARSGFKRGCKQRLPT